MPPIIIGLPAELLTGVSVTGYTNKELVRGSTVT